MKNLSLYILVLVVISLSSFTYNFGAPTEKNLTGKWESVFRKGPENCGNDFILILNPNKNATLVGGSRYSECEDSQVEMFDWKVSKIEAYAGRKAGKWNAIVLKDKEDEENNVNILIDEFVGDYMSVYLEVVSGDTTAPKKFIMKKVQ